MKNVFDADVNRKKILFGADGIRGKIDHYPFRAEDLIYLGQALAQWWFERTSTPVLLIGTDTRESNQRIKAALADGLTKAGIEIWDAEILPTAALSFIVAKNPELAGGIMISASHNPIFENGIKVFEQRGMKISDPEEAKIEELFFSEPSKSFQTGRPAAIRPATRLLDQYTQSMIDQFEDIHWRTHKVLMDCANGASYRTAQTVLKKLGIHHSIHNIMPDGTNINFGVGSEHVRKYPQEFTNELHKSNALLGVAFDGDADRVVFVDREGLFYDGDMLLAIAALFLQENGLFKTKRVVITQMSNSGLNEHLGIHDIQTRQVRNGDKYITDLLVEDGLSLGGEQIGHLIFHTDPLNVTGDGLRTFLWVLKALSHASDASLHDLMYGMKKWPQINASVPLGERMHFKTDVIPGLDECQAQVKSEFPGLSKFECRPASTEPTYRIMLEAKDIPAPVLAEQALRLAYHVQKHYGRLGEPVEILDCVTGGRISPNATSGCPG